MARFILGLLAFAVVMCPAAVHGGTPPWPVFAVDSRVRVEVGGAKIANVISVEGNLFTTNVVLFRDGSDGSVRKTLGPSTPGDIIVRRSVRTDDVLWDWYQQILGGNLQRKDIAVVYLGSNGQPVVRFDLVRCFPSAYALHAGSSLLTVTPAEAVTISCEGVTRTRDRGPHHGDAPHAGALNHAAALVLRLRGSLHRWRGVGTRCSPIGTSTAARERRASVCALTRAVMSVRVHAPDATVSGARWWSLSGIRLTRRGGPHIVALSSQRQPARCPAMRRVLPSCTACTILLLLTAIVCAQAPSPQGAEFRANTFTTDAQQTPAAGMASDGSFVIVWASGNPFGASPNQDGSWQGVYGQRYNSAGVAQGAEFRSNTWINQSQFDPQVAVRPSGEFVVVWTTTYQPDSCCGYDVFGQRYDAAGAAQGAEFPINQGANLGSQHEPAIASDASGNFIVTWQSSQEGIGNSGIYARRFNASGSPLADEFHVNTTTAFHQTAPDVAVDADGDFVVVWVDGALDLSGDSVYGQRYNSSGVPQGGEFRVNTTTSASQNRPSIAMDSSGNFVVAFENQVTGGDASGTGISAQRFNAAGVAQGGEFRVNTFTTGNQSAPSVAMESDGPFLITWQSANQDGSGIGVYGQRYNAAGAPLGGEFRVNTTTTSDQADPFVAAAGGAAVVVWRSDGQDGSGSGAYGQRYALPAPGPPGTLQFSTSAYTVGEGVGPATVTVTRTGGSSGTVSVSYATSNGTATAGPDYASSSGTLTFVDGDGASKTFTVAVTDDLLFETNETVNLALSGPTGGATLGIPSTGILTIVDNDGTPPTGEFLVNTYTTSNQWSPSVAVDGADRFIVTWASFNQNGPLWGVYAQRFDNRALPISGEFPVNQTTDSAVGSNVAAAADGRFAVAWESPDRNRVYARLFDAQAAPVASEFPVSATTMDATDPDIAMTPTGQFVVVWRDVIGSSDVNVYAQRYDAAGAAQGGAILANASGALYRGSPGVAIDASGRFVVTWEVAAGNAYDVYYRLFDAQGVPQTNETKVNVNKLFLPSPDVAMDQAGSFVVLWKDKDFLTAQRFDSTGARLGSELQVKAGNTFYWPVLSKNATGTFVNAWIQQDSLAPNVYARFYAGDGNGIGAEVPVNTGPVDYSRVGAAVESSGDKALIVWSSKTSANQDGSGNGVYARLVTAGAGGPSGSFQFNASNYSTAESANAVITVTRSGGSFGTVTVNYTVGGGTATSVADYTPASGTLTFGPGETTKTFTAVVLDDTVDEPDETVGLTLSNPTGGATLGSQTSATLTILDDDDPVPNAKGPFYLAEGATGFFDLDFAVANPNPLPAPIKASFLKPDGAIVTLELTLPATSRGTIRVNEIPGLESTALSTVIESKNGLPLVVERTMSWDRATGYGGHTEKAGEGVRRQWFFAEGSQGFFDTFVLLANPQPTPNTATVTFLREGEPPLTRT